MEERKREKGKRAIAILNRVILILVLVLVIGVGIIFVLHGSEVDIFGLIGTKEVEEVEEEPEVELITEATLKQIINMSELSAYQAVYNGVAVVMSEEDATEVGYYVSYEAKITAGLEFEDITVRKDDINKSIIVTLPTIKLNEPEVDIASLDYMFMNSEEELVTAKAFTACSEDAASESEQIDEIIELAKQNAVNIINALVKPFVEELEPEYTLVVE